MRLRHRLVLAGLCLGLATPAGRVDAQEKPAAEAARPTVLDAAIRALVNDATFKDALVGVAVLDVDSGELLGAAGEHTALNPASNAKVYTAACALSTLEGSHRYATVVQGHANGANVDHVAIRGSGDPSLETGDLLMLAKDLHARGIRKVDGDVLVDQRFFDDQTTPPAFEQQPNEWASFRAPVSALAVNENTVTLTTRPGEVGGNAFVQLEPPGFVDVEGSIATREGGANTVGLTLAGSGQRLHAKLSGAIGKDTTILRYARRVEDPRLLGGYVFKWALEQLGIKVTGEVKQGQMRDAPVLAEHVSKPLSTLLYELGKASNNFYAEMVFKTLAREGPASSAAASGVVTRWLEKHQLSDEGVVIKNGSGLFDANRVTAWSMVKVLRHMWRSPGAQAEFVSQLSVGGADGTLQGRFKNLSRTRIVRAKTGTLEGSISLSGYVLGPPGRGPVAFAVLFNKVAGKAQGARAAADKLVGTLAEQVWRTH
jgi:serine-type D-Ala-D-Ala carboxypeptidase/endopeptidase (penicillin-binding protein 4)